MIPISAPLFPSWLAQLLLLQRRARRTRPARLACVQMLSACSRQPSAALGRSRSNKVENRLVRQGKARVCNIVSAYLCFPCLACLFSTLLERRSPKAALGCREHADSICTHARRAGLVRHARLCSSSSCASHDGNTGAEIGRDLQTAVARMPGGQASSGAPVSAAAASAQATTGAEAQKSVSYGQVTSMATVATGASKDVATSLLLSRVAVSAYGVTS